MPNYIERVKNFILDPLGVRQVVNSINSKASMLQGDIFHTTKRTEELIKAFCDFEKKYDRYRLLDNINKALDASVPDMFWVKGIDGKYLIANKQIRDNLLFDENPIGKDDRELAEAIKAVVGEDKHTFGAICGNSDVETLKRGVPSKFNEDGLVNGEYMMLQVHKNIVKDDKGEVIAVVGVGRDITYQVSVLNDVLNKTECLYTKEKIVELLNHYKFEDRT